MRDYSFSLDWKIIHGQDPRVNQLGGTFPYRPESSFVSQKPEEAGIRCSAAEKPEFRTEPPVAGLGDAAAGSLVLSPADPVFASWLRRQTELARRAAAIASAPSKPKPLRDCQPAGHAPSSNNQLLRKIWKSSSA